MGVCSACASVTPPGLTPARLDELAAISSPSQFLVNEGMKVDRVRSGISYLTGSPGPSFAGGLGNAPGEVNDHDFRNRWRIATPSWPKRY